MVLVVNAHRTLCLHTERLIVVSEWHEDCLENHVKSGRYGSSQAISRLARQLLLALDHLHSQGITHRGISPGNVLLTVEVGVALTACLSHTHTHTHTHV